MTIGDLYFNSTNNYTYVFNGMVWQVASIPPDLIPYMESVRDEVVLLEQQAEASATAAAAQATAAAGSAATAVANANNSQLSANNSASSATAAAGSAAAAAGSASTASQDASDAEAARIAAQASATAAANSETAAANSETAAANSATAAANSATAAANSATAAANSQVVVEAAKQDYRGSWYGPLASAPTQDPFGDPVEEGDAYFDTTDKLLKVYNGTTWTLGTVPPGVLGTAATHDVATEAEALAGTADVLPDAEQVRAVIAQDVPSASDTAAGRVALATDVEVQAGTDSQRAITPATLSSRTATETRTGLVELATEAEATAGTDTQRAMTPARVKSAIATLGFNPAKRTLIWTGDAANYDLDTATGGHPGTGWYWINDAYLAYFIVNTGVNSPSAIFTAGPSFFRVYHTAASVVSIVFVTAAGAVTKVNVTKIEKGGLKC